MNLQIVDSQLSCGRDDVDLVQLYQFENKSFRLRLRSNSYKIQCFAVAEMWTPQGWVEVWTLQPAFMSTKEGLCYDKNVSANNFARDMATLLTKIEDICL